MNEYLNDLKKDYQKLEATEHLKISGWSDLAGRIGLLETPRRRMRLSYFVAAFAVLLIFLFGTYQIAQAALPGDTLYPVKLLSEKLVQKTSGDNQIVIDHRAEEILGLSKAQEVDKEALEKVVIEYKESVDAAKTEKRNENFQNKLKNQHSEFDKLGHDHPDIEKEIKDAEDASGK